MFRKIIYLVVFLLGLSMNSQTVDRVAIAGKVYLPGNEITQGITIFNEDTSKGAITDADGEFEIEVALNDKLKFSSLVFQDFSVKIEAGVIVSKVLNIYVSETYTQLPEVLVTPNKLSGNVYVDLVRLQVAKPNVPTYSAKELSEYDIAPDANSKSENYAMSHNELRLENGLNFVNIFKVIVKGINEERTTELPDIEIDDNVRKLYDDEFFKKYLDLELEEINDFIFYASDHGLNKQMLKEGKDLDLISFLIEQSRSYKKMKSEN